MSMWPRSTMEPMGPCLSIDGWPAAQSPGTPWVGCGGSSGCRAAGEVAGAAPAERSPELRPGCFWICEFRRGIVGTEGILRPGSRGKGDQYCNGRAQAAQLSKRILNCWTPKGANIACASKSGMDYAD